jgi:hypothetical protein
MYIAITNFVFPVLFSLVQIIIVYCEVNPVVVNDIVLVNTSIAVIGVVFATVWAGSGHRNEQGSQKTGTPLSNTQASPGKGELSTVIFQSNWISTHGTMSRCDAWDRVVEEGRESPVDKETQF